MLSNRHPLPAPGPISVLIWMPKDKGLNSSRPRMTKARPQIFLRVNGTNIIFRVSSI